MTGPHRRVRLTGLAAMLALMTVQAKAQPVRGCAHDLPAGRLDAALRQLAEQCGIAVGGTDAGLGAVATPALRGPMSAPQALRRLLARSGYRAVRISATAYRIEQLPPRRTPRIAGAPMASDLTGDAAIIVTASKSGAELADYPGGAAMIDLGETGDAGLVPSLETAIKALPQTAATALGAGRNKLFVRGIADSSFNGPTQATIGLYLGEQRLIYSAPNPDLRLYDAERVELLEGPQGTLYGAGALGGVLRMTPRAPDPDGWAGQIWAGAGLAEGARPSFDGAAMVNAPIADNAALRVLGYGGREGGYVDDRTRGLPDVNRVDTSGFRAALGIDPGPGWHVVASGFGQWRRIADGQYVDPRLPGLQRDSLIAQPFASDIIGASVTVNGRIGSLDLVSTTGVVSNALDTRYDSSMLGGPGARQAFDEARRIELITHETRIASPQQRGFAWLVGFSFLHNRDDYTQLVTALRGPDPPPFANIRYRISEYALFGEAAIRLTPTLRATLGGRLIVTESRSTRLFGANVVEDADNPPVRFLPMAALSWQPRPDLIVYARYQRSYRTGGVTVERADNGDPVPTRFDADSLQSVELGTRARFGRTRLTLTGFYTRWTDIQGDLIQNQGFPITRNIGDGWIVGATASAAFRFGRIWHAEAALFVNHSRIDRLAPGQVINNRPLPNVAAVSASASGGARWPLAGDRSIAVDATLRYVGRSYLDIDPTSQVPQGNYVDSRIAAVYRVGGLRLGVAIDNLFGVRGNRFAFGNPFAVRLAPQATPLVPRQLRLSASWAF